MCTSGTVTVILSKHPTCIQYAYNTCMSTKTHALNKTNLSLSYYLPDEFPYTLAETTQGRIDSPRKLAETTHLPRPKRTPQNWPKRPRPKRLRPKRPWAENDTDSDVSPINYSDSYI